MLSTFFHNSFASKAINCCKDKKITPRTKRRWHPEKRKSPRSEQGKLPLFREGEITAF
jgi:hypothetical protein